MTGFGIGSNGTNPMETIPLNTDSTTTINCDPNLNRDVQQTSVPAPPPTTTSSSRRRSRVDVSNDQIVSFGHIVLGSNSPSPLAISHYNSMISTMRKPITMWHVFQPLGEPMANVQGPPPQVPLTCTPAPPPESGQPNYGVNSNYDYEATQNYSGQWLGPVNDGLAQWPTTQVVYQDTTMAINNFHNVKL